LGYFVKEIFYTLQGEGFNSGRPAVFCRFSGCNLWSGREGDRAKSVCKFCDTDFLGTDGPEGGRFESSSELAQKVASFWPDERSKLARPFVVCTGGEPLLQLDSDLVEAFHKRGFEVASDTFYNPKSATRRYQRMPSSTSPSPKPFLLPSEAGNSPQRKVLKMEILNWFFCWPNSIKARPIFLPQIGKKRSRVKRTPPQTLQTYIHPHSGLQTFFLSLRMGSASSWKDKHHLF